MQNVIAITIRHSVVPAIVSLHNATLKLVEWMYGTEERARMTCYFALVLLLLGISIAQSNPAMLAVCVP